MMIRRKREKVEQKDGGVRKISRVRKGVKKKNKWIGINQRNQDSKWCLWYHSYYFTCMSKGSASSIIDNIWKFSGRLLKKESICSLIAAEEKPLNSNSLISLSEIIISKHIHIHVMLRGRGWFIICCAPIGWDRIEYNKMR